MITEYIYLQKLTKTQKEKVNFFNKDPKIEYEEIFKCEICETNKFKLLFKNDRYGINQKTYRCYSCGFVFSNPRMTEKSARFFYSSDYYRLMYEEGISDLDYLLKDTVTELKQYKPSRPKKPNMTEYYENLYFDFINNEILDFETVLDVGCGKGKKLLDFNFLGKITEGIELSNTFHKAHVELGLNCKIGSLNDIKKKYDLVILSHVFEHMFNLKKVVNILENITKKYLFIEVPGHIKKLQSIQNAHNYYFSFNTLNYFFLNKKFELIKIDYEKNTEFIFALYKKKKNKNNFFFFKKKKKKIKKKFYIKKIKKYFKKKN